MTKLKKAEKIRDHFLDAEICQTKASIFSDFDKILTPKERMLSWSIQKYIIELSTDTTFRNIEKRLNRFLHRDGSCSFHHRTIADFIEHTGKSLNEVIDEHVIEVLEKNNFNTDTALPDNPESLLGSVKNLKSFLKKK